MGNGILNSKPIPNILPVKFNVQSIAREHVKWETSRTNKAERKTCELLDTANAVDRIGT